MNAACVLEKRGTKSMHIFIKVGEIKGRKIISYIFPLYIVFLSFSEKIYRSLRSLDCVLSPT